MVLLPPDVRFDFYPRPPRGGRPQVGVKGDVAYNISIHALREEGDCRGSRASFSSLKFLSTPSARRATLILTLEVILWKFLSTPSARRATAMVKNVRRDSTISIHALREEGDGSCATPNIFASPISIHALREEGDRGSLMAFLSLFIFLSTPSARRATVGSVGNVQFSCISIHALREEGDPARIPLMSTAMHFYPRPPRGGRPA